jgi:hypothetical protein
VPIKRVNYYEHEFLHASDFIAEQDYHRGMRHRHNRLLHTPGIGDGLDVTFQSGSTKVTIGSGTGVDDLGQEIVIPDGETRTYELSSAKAPAGQTAVVYLTIAYDDKPDDPTTEAGGAGNTRVSEDPAITHLANPPQNPTRRLLLAKVTMSDSAVQSVDKTGRLTAGAVAGDLAVSSLRLKAPNVDSSKWVTIAGTGVNQSSLTGSLSIAKSTSQSTDGMLTVANGLTVGAASAPAKPLDVTGHGFFRGGGAQAAVSGAAGLLLGLDSSGTPGAGFLTAHDATGKSLALTLSGSPIVLATNPGGERIRLDPNGNLGIGIAAPGRRLHVEGSEIHSGGADAGFSFGDRATTGFAEGSGERWVLYSQGQTARLWVSGLGDRLGVTTAGNLGIGNVNPVSRLQVAGDVALQQIGGGAARSLPTGSTLVWNDGTWLRLNQNLDFSKPIFGVHTPGVLAPVSLNVGGAGNWADPGGGQVWMTGNLGTRGMHPTTGLPSGWGGGVHTFDVYAEATVAAGPAGGPPRAWINSSGQVAGTSKPFFIDHPLDPAKKQLVHAAIEGPELAVYYRGEARLQRGEATVELPPYFEALTRKQNRTVTLTPRTDAADSVIAPLAASTVEDGQFTVRIAEGGDQRQRFYWEVKAVRSDLPALQIERDK